MELYNLIEDLSTKKNRIVIAIDGPSAAGKSSLSKKLTEKYNALLIRIDDYFLPETMKTKERLSEIGGFFHYERFIDEVVNHIYDDTLHLQKFNCMTQLLEDKIEYKNSQIIIIEGVYSLHPLLRDMYDISIFMDVERDEQIKRIEKRNGTKMLDKWINIWLPLENRYFIEFNIKNIADIVMKI